MLALYLSMLDSQDNKHRMAEIYEMYKYDCLHVAMRIVHNQAMAEDAVHDAFLAIIKHKDKIFELSGRDLRSQIVIIVKNKCIDLLRKSNRISGIAINDLADSLDSGEVPVDIQSINKEEFARLTKHLDAIDEISRLVLQMKYIQGLSYKEIGYALGLTPKHVETRIARAKRKVRKLFDKDGHEDEE